MFLSERFLYLAIFPDGIIRLDNGKFGLVEVKCPYKHRKNSIEVACKDTTLITTILLLTRLFNVSDKILYSLILLIAFSTLILALAIVRDWIPSLVVSQP